MTFETEEVGEAYNLVIGLENLVQEWKVQIRVGSFHVATDFISILLHPLKRHTRQTRVENNLSIVQYERLFTFFFFYLTFRDLDSPYENFISYI